MAETMWSLQWSDELSVGVAGIDNEHRYFIEQLNELNKAIIDKGNSQEIQTRLRAILDSTFQHFLNEEELLKQWDYPGVDHHVRVHQAISAELERIAKSLDKKSTVHEWIEAAIQIKQILVNHLLNEDMKYKAYFVSQVS